MYREFNSIIRSIEENKNIKNKLGSFAVLYEYYRVMCGSLLGSGIIDMYEDFVWTCIELTVVSCKCEEDAEVENLIKKLDSLVLMHPGAIILRRKNAQSSISEYANEIKQANIVDGENGNLEISAKALMITRNHISNVYDNILWAYGEGETANLKEYIFERLISLSPALLRNKDLKTFKTKLKEVTKEIIDECVSNKDFDIHNIKNGEFFDFYNSISETEKKIIESTIPYLLAGYEEEDFKSKGHPVKEFASRLGITKTEYRRKCVHLANKMSESFKTSSKFTNGEETTMKLK